MDYYQRKMLEIEVETHRVRIRELLDELRNIENNMGDAADPPREILRKAEKVRIELKGRRAAYAIGSAHLKSLTAA